MSSFTERKTLMCCLKQFLEKVMVNQHYRSSERGKAGMFPLQQVFLVFIYFFFSMTSWLSSNQTRTGVLHKKRVIAISRATTKRRIQSLDITTGMLNVSVKEVNYSLF